MSHQDAMEITITTEYAALAPLTHYVYPESATYRIEQDGGYVVTEFTAPATGFQLLLSPDKFEFDVYVDEILLLEKIAFVPQCQMSPCPIDTSPFFSAPYSLFSIYSTDGFNQVTHQTALPVPHPLVWFGAEVANLIAVDDAYADCISVSTAVTLDVSGEFKNLSGPQFLGTLDHCTWRIDNTLIGETCPIEYTFPSTGLVRIELEAFWSPITLTESLSREVTAVCE